MITDAQQPSALSPREGKLLKLVPLESRLNQADIVRNLELAIQSRLQHESPSMLVDACTKGDPQQPIVRSEQWSTGAIIYEKPGST